MFGALSVVDRTDDMSEINAQQRIMDRTLPIETLLGCISRIGVARPVICEPALAESGCRNIALLARLVSNARWSQDLPEQRILMSAFTPRVMWTHNA